MGNIIARDNMKWDFPLSSPNGNLPSPYLYHIALDHEIAPGMLFHDSLVEIANAHRKHDNGLNYTCYGSWIGKGIVWLLYPMNFPDDIKKYINDEQCLVDIKGNEGKEIYQKFRSTLISDQKKIMKYVPELSNVMKREGETPYEYLYYITLKIKPNNDNFDLKLIDTIKDKHKSNPRGLRWVTYQETDSDILHIFIPMRKFGDMDEWPTFSELFASTELTQSSKLRKTIYSNILDSKSYIMTFVPSCDNSGCDFIE